MSSLSLKQCYKFPQASTPGGSDVNFDGKVTITDFQIVGEWFFFLPGRLGLELVDWVGLGTFFEIDCQSMSNWFVWVISTVIWLWLFLILLSLILNVALFFRDVFAPR